MESGSWARRAVFIIAVVVTVAAVVGCGQPGADGDAYIAYSWAVGPITIASNDPAFAGASYVYNGEFLKTSPGVYDFEYIAWDSSYWWGWYEIYVNPGEDGGMFGAGEDGSDLYFELLCLSTGPSFYVWSSSASALSGAGAGDMGPADAGAVTASGGAGVASEPLAVLGAGLVEVPVADAGAGPGGGLEEPAAPGDASEPRGKLGELGGPLPAGAETAAGATDRGAAVVETVRLPGVTVVFGFGGGAE